MLELNQTNYLVAGPQSNDNRETTGDWPQIMHGPQTGFGCTALANKIRYDLLNLKSGEFLDSVYKSGASLSPEIHCWGVLYTNVQLRAPWCFSLGISGWNGSGHLGSDLSTAEVNDVMPGTTLLFSNFAKQRGGQLYQSGSMLSAPQHRTTYEEKWNDIFFI